MTDQEIIKQACAALKDQIERHRLKKTVNLQTSYWGRVCSDWLKQNYEYRLENELFDHHKI